MSKNQHVGPLQLEADIRDGVIDTVIVAFSDHQGRLIGKRTDGEFYLDVVAEEGTENCDYLIACDIDNVPIPGFRWASYDQGYGDMRGVVDPSTIRYLPWLDRTAVVLVDLVDVDTGRAGRGVAASNPAGPGRQGGGPRLRADDRQRGRVLLVQGDVRRGQRRGLPRAHAELAVPRGLPHPADDEGGGRPRRRSGAACAAPGFPVEFSKGEAGKGQHEVNLTYMGAVEMADTNLIFKNAVKEIAAIGRSVGDVHGQAALRRRRLELPHPLEPVVGRHVEQPDARAARAPTSSEPRRAPHERAVPLVPRRPDRDRPRVLVAVRSEPQQLQALPTGELGADGHRMGRRQPHARVPRRRSRQRDAGREPDPRCRRQLLPRLRGHDRRRAVRHRATDRPAAAVRGQRLHGDRSRAHPVELTRRRSSCGATSAIAKECFGDDVHHHVLHHAESEWLAFNQTVTDWERRRYFERI